MNLKSQEKKMKKVNWLTTGGIVLLLLVVSIWQSPAVFGETTLPQGLSSEEVIEALTGEDVTRLEGGMLPYYSTENKLNYFQSGEFTFRVDSVSGQFIEVYPFDSSREFTLMHKELELEELEELAKEYIEKLNIQVNYDLLRLNIGDKGELNYFFRWNAGSPEATGFGNFFIQVGLTKDGQLLNLVNTLPFMKQESYSREELSATVPNSFTEVYANDGSYWGIDNGNPLSASGYGYCGSANGSWCSPYSIRYATTMTGIETVKAHWSPRGNLNTRVSAYIPSNYETTTSACYKVNGVSYPCLNQSIYYDTWLLITPNKISSGINSVALGNKDPNRSSYVACDEIWVYDY